MNNALLIVIFNALLLAVGILTVLVSCLQFSNWYPLISIAVNLMAILQLMMCGSCNNEQGFSMDSTFQDAGIHISWMLFGLLVMIGYAVPGLLFRATVIPQIALYFAWIGGTVILASMIIYLRLIWNRE